MSLPKPQNEYQIDLPDAPVEDNAWKTLREDEADVRAREAAQLAEYQAMQMRKRSQAVQRDLPRPVELNLSNRSRRMRFPNSSTRKRRCPRARHRQVRQETEISRT